MRTDGTPLKPGTQENLQEKVVSVCIIYNNAHGNRRRDAIFLQKWRKNAGRATLRRPSPPVATAARHRWGVVYNPEGRRKAPAALNSPPPTNVPLHVTSRGFYAVIRTMDAAAASYRQVRGEGGGFEPGAEKMKRPKGRGEKLKFRRAHSAMCVRYGCGLRGHMMRGMPCAGDAGMIPCIIFLENREIGVYTVWYHHRAEKGKRDFGKLQASYEGR